MGRIIGIDVSEHNGTLDWAKIKKAGIEFAIIRTGYGTSHVDTQFKNNIKGAIEQGIHIGAYHFSYALNESGAKNEADFVSSLLQPYKEKIDMPVFFDFEYDTVSYAKKQGVTLGKAAFNNHTVAFCEQIKKAGYTAGTYYNLSYLNSYVDKSKIGKYVKWFAQYASAPGTSDYALWQYSSSYKIDGINCKFDINILKDTSIIKNGIVSEEEEEDMSYDKFKEYMNQYLGEVRSLDGHVWSQEARDWSVETGIIKGTNVTEFDGDWQDYVTREMMVTMLKRFKDLLEQ